MSQGRMIFYIVAFILIGIFWSIGGSTISDYAPYYVQRALGQSAHITIGSDVVKAEVERSNSAHQKGLSGRHEFMYDHGMLFVFSSASAYEFWMKDMHFNLDMVWIRNATIVYISRNVPAPAKDAAPATVTPTEAADTVLEVRAGAAAMWKVGDPVDVQYDRFFFRNPA